MTSSKLYWENGTLLKCPFGHGAIKRRGIYSNVNGIVQRYQCLKCRASFTHNTVFNRQRGLSGERLRIPKEKQESAKRAFLAGHKCRDVVESFGISMATAIKIRRIALTSGAYVGISENYPCCKPDEGESLLDAILCHIPESYSNDVRAEVCQEIAVEILSGRLALCDVSKKIPDFVKAHFFRYPRHTGNVSLDQVLSQDEGDERTLMNCILTEDQRDEVPTVNY